MNEIYEAKVADVRAGKTKQGMDLMGMFSTHLPVRNSET